MLCLVKSEDEYLKLAAIKMAAENNVFVVLYYELYNVHFIDTLI